MPSAQRVGAIGDRCQRPLEMCVRWMTDGWSHRQRCHCYPECMTVRDLLATLQRLPKDIEVLAFEAACQFSPVPLGSATNSETSRAW